MSEGIVRVRKPSDLRTMADHPSDARTDQSACTAPATIRLQRENFELKRANEILRKASAYFAQAELDRRAK